MGKNKVFNLEEWLLENLKTVQYRKEYFEAEQRKEQARKLFNTGKITLREMYARFTV